nr:LysR substrate-binding domain-containing protein [Pseudomonas syringae]
MSRAMVTRYLAQMERWAGARLLHRTTRKLGLTAPGQVTLLRCQQLVELADAVPLAADTQVDEPRGMLRIACSQSLAQAVLAPAVTAYLQRYPDTSADLLIGNEAVDLVSERIDLAIRITNQLDPMSLPVRWGSALRWCVLLRPISPCTAHRPGRRNCLLTTA